MILIITNKEDTHPTPVIERLSALRVPVFRLKPEARSAGYGLGRPDRCCREDILRTGCLHNESEPILTK